MKINLSKLKILKHLKLNILNGFTNKINFNKHFKKTVKIYKLPFKIKILKILYNLSKNKIKLYLNKLNINNLIKLLNSLKLRLDYILLNSNLFLTLNQTRQNISHNHIIINNKIINSYTKIIKNNNIIYINNINKHLLKNILSYNYIIKHIKNNLFNSKILKFLKFKKNKKKIILKLNKINLNNTICNKYFKIKINFNNLYDTFI